jgi:ribonuclease HI
MSDERVVVYTDGACSKNPGPGGWGAILLFRSFARFVSGFSPETTNNKMELSAAIGALKALSKTSIELEIHTDSMYLKNGIEEWIPSWRSRGWKTFDKKPVKNREYWEELDKEAKRHHVHWRWVKGHGSSRYNNFVDWLARDAIANQKGRDQKGPINEIENFIDQTLL